MAGKSASVVLGVLLAFAVVPGVAPATAASATIPFSISTSPPLVPAFSAGTPNYVVACAGHATTRVTTTGASVIGGRQVVGNASLQAHLAPGQALEITGGGHQYFARCLPADFPKYSASVTGTPQAPGMLVTPSTSLTGPAGHYVVAFDAHGVPVWWYRDRNVPVDAKFFGPSTIGWASGPAAVTGGTFSLRGLNGALKHTVGGPKQLLDEHDVQRLPDGNYLAILDVAHPAVDLSSWGLSPQASITDNVVAELNGQNQVLWSWSVTDHIDVATANVNWRSQFPDVIHMNSIQYFGDHELLISIRHFDAVYAINMRTGAILWKLGGSPTPQSLTVAHDQYATPQDPGDLFSGQHDARINPDGTLTVQDNGTQRLRPVRALRFAVSPATHSATELGQVADTRIGPAFCCGGVDRLSTGDWLASWGTANFVTELTPSGVAVLTVNYPAYFSYRVAPITPSIAALRGGMDAMVAPLRL